MCHGNVISPTFTTMASAFGANGMNVITICPVSISWSKSSPEIRGSAKVNFCGSVCDHPAYRQPYETVQDYKSTITTDTLVRITQPSLFLENIVSSIAMATSLSQFVLSFDQSFICFQSNVRSEKICYDLYPLGAQHWFQTFVFKEYGKERHRNDRNDGEEAVPLSWVVI